MKLPSRFVLNLIIVMSSAYWPLLICDAGQSLLMAQPSPLSRDITKADTEKAKGTVTLRSLQVGTLRRTYWIALPSVKKATASETEAATKKPLIIMLHGGGGSGSSMDRITRAGFRRRAEEFGAIVVYPNGESGHWNDGRNDPKIPPQAKGVDDVGFIRTLIDQMVATDNVDANRVYVGGLSNGAMMSARLACELSDKIAAVAMVSGSMPAQIYKTCLPRSTVSVLMINGLADPLVPYGGGQVTILGMSRGSVISVSDTASMYATFLGYDSKTEKLSTKTWPDRIPKDGTRVTEQRYRNKTGAETVLYSIAGGGHGWPMGTPFAPASLIGTTSQEFNATQMIWNFFLSHPKQN